MKPELHPLAERFGLRDIYVFGSRAVEFVDASSEQSRASRTADLDIGIQPLEGHSLSPRERVLLADELERLFRVPRVDLVVLSEARAFLALEVVRGELLYTADPLAQAEQELYVLRRAADLAPFHKERTRLILESGAR